MLWLIVLTQLSLDTHTIPPAFGHVLKLHEQPFSPQHDDTKPSIFIIDDQSKVSYLNQFFTKPDERTALYEMVIDPSGYCLPYDGSKINFSKTFENFLWSPGSQPITMILDAQGQDAHALAEQLKCFYPEVNIQVLGDLKLFPKDTALINNPALSNESPLQRKLLDLKDSEQIQAATQDFPFLKFFDYSEQRVKSLANEILQAADSKQIELSDESRKLYTSLRDRGELPDGYQLQLSRQHEPEAFFFRHEEKSLEPLKEDSIVIFGQQLVIDPVTGTVNKVGNIYNVETVNLFAVSNDTNKRHPLDTQGIPNVFAPTSFERQFFLKDPSWKNAERDNHPYMTPLLKTFSTLYKNNFLTAPLVEEYIGELPNEPQNENK